jgi:endonuclease/exonuclease/phosphatase (EEP) superfamily protein YafD
MVSEQPIPESFSVLSWNIEKGANANWIADLAQIAGAEHVLLIQEAALDPETGALSLPRDFTSRQYFAVGYRQGSIQTGVLTASPWVASHHCALTAWEPWLGTPKATSVTRYDFYPNQATGESGRLEAPGAKPNPLMVVNVHAVNFAVGLEAYIEQFVAIGEVIMAHEGPLILAGDFNTWSEDRQEWLAGFMARHQLEAVTFSPDHRTTVFSRPIDHIYTRGLAVIDASVVTVDSSDHNPLLMTVRWLDD